MKDIYLLMRPELIRATLKGQKWQTRRIMKHQPEVIAGDWWVEKSRGGGYWHWDNAQDRIMAECPYGKPGDLAVVREAVGCNDEYPVQQSMQLFRERGAGLPNGPLAPQQLEFWQKYVVYRASTPEPPYLVAGWRSPLHMPRWAARIVRPITEIRIERVAEISERDAIAEGVEPIPSSNGPHHFRVEVTKGGKCIGYYNQPTAQGCYQFLWNSINAKPKPRYGREGGKKIITHYEAFPWSLEDFDAMFSGARVAGTWKGKPLTVHANPFVWCISFERVEEAAHGA